MAATDMHSTNAVPYRGGVVAIAGGTVDVRETGDFESGGGTLLRFAMICIFLRSAARRV